MTAVDRQQRVDAADASCSAAFTRALGKRTSGADETGVALVAVGGYGRRELAPYSDLDVVLVHTEDADVTEVAAEVWYPLWDAGATIDHAVRALPDVTAAARQDVRVALGLLDARHLAGDPSVTLRMRSSLLAQWRRDARHHLPELREMVRRRVERLGELAHASVPDLKESGGGLRDATILNALVATWLVDVPHTDLERSRQTLLDVRDALQAVAGRPSDRIGPDMWTDLAAALGHDGAAETQRLVREIGRRITHISRLTWRRVDAVLSPAPAGARRSPGPVMTPIGHGLAVTGGEVVVQRRDAVADPMTLLRAAAEAAERDLILSPHTAARLVRESPAPPEPWPEEARRAPRAPAGRRARPARGVGDARRDRCPPAVVAGVGAREAASARLRGPSVHRRPAPGRDLHRGLAHDPPRLAARPAARRRAGARHRQGRPAGPQHRRRAHRHGVRPAPRLLRA